MKVYQIIEARKNPELNPKTPINDIVSSAVDNTTDEIAGTKNLFVSFTAIEKIGVNPLSKYNTPIGIYAYPGEYVKSHVGSAGPMTLLPMAGEQPYANTFKAHGNIINLATISSAEVSALYKKIVKVYADAMQRAGTQDQQAATDRVMQYMNNAPKKATFSSYPGGQLWYVTRIMSKDLLAKVWNTKPAVAWNKLFRLIGVDGCVDYTPKGGVGIIHNAEPSQAVFFSTNSITNVSRHNNKYSSDYGNRAEKIKRGEETHASIARIAPELNSITDPEKAYEYLSSTKFEYIRLIKNQEIRNYILTKRPDMIAALKYSTPEDQVTAIKRDPYVIYYIRNPDEAAVTKGLQVHTQPEFNALFVASKFPSATEELQNIIIDRDRTAAQYFTKSYPTVVRKLLAAYDARQETKPKWLKSLAKSVGIRIQKTIPAASDAMKENEILMRDIKSLNTKNAALKQEIEKLLTGVQNEQIIALVKKQYQKEIDKNNAEIAQLKLRITPNKQ